MLFHKHQLSQPNNKTTITVVGLRQSIAGNTTTRNSKLRDRADIEKKPEDKSYKSILGDRKTDFEPYPNSKLAY